MYREANLLLGDIVKVVCLFVCCTIDVKVKSFHHMHLDRDYIHRLWFLEICFKSL